MPIGGAWMQGKQLFNLIPPRLPRVLVKASLAPTISCASSLSANFSIFSAFLNKVGIVTEIVPDTTELFENKNWIILYIKEGRFLLRSAAATPGQLTNVYTCEYSLTRIRITALQQEYFHPKQGIETEFTDLEFCEYYGFNKANTDFLAKLKSECTSLKDSMANLLKEWKDYLGYEKTTVDLLHRCTVNAQIKDNGDIVIKFLRDVGQYDEFFPEQNEYLELEKQKFNKALSERTLEFIKTEEDRPPYTLLSIPCKELEEGEIKPFIRNGKVIGLVLKNCENERIDYSNLKRALLYGDTIEVSLKDIGKASQIRRFEGCLNTLDQCNTPASIRVLLWLMEYANNCGRALDKAYWEKITDFKNADLNKEQQEAVQLILNTTDISFIMGPPGTGKTSVIAEAIYQLAKRGKKILLSSQSNDAIDNALDRLKANPDIRAVRLVSREDYPDKTFDRSFFAWNMVSSLDEDIKRAVAKVDDFLHKYEKLPQTPPQEILFKKYIYELATSRSVGNLSVFKNRLKQDYPWKLGDPFHAFLGRFINITCGRPENQFIRFEEYLTKLHLLACKLQKLPVPEADWIHEGAKTISTWKDLRFVAGPDAKTLQRQNEIRQSFTNIREALNTADFDADSDAQTLKNPYNESFYAKLVRTANVFGITCNANNDKLISELMQGSVEYDYVIIDEVSKATTLELLAPMLKAPRCILIGDHHQLPPVFLADDDLKENEELCYKYEDLITNTFFKS